MADVATREVKKLPTLRGKTVINLFFEDSTRTRTSFEVAAKRLERRPDQLQRQGLERFEGRRPQGHRADPRGDGRRRGRHPARGIRRRPGAGRERLDRRLRSSTPATARTSTRRRPSSTRSRCASDSTATRRAGRDLDGLNVTIVGDILHSRVARSNVWLLQTLGAHVTLVAPPTLLPNGRRALAGDVGYDLDEAIAANPDVVMMLRIQAERMNAAFFPNTREYSRQWGLDDERLGRLRAGYDGHAPRSDGPRSRDLGRGRRLEPVDRARAGRQRGVDKDGRALPAARE